MFHIGGSGKKLGEANTMNVLYKTKNLFSTKSKGEKGVGSGELAQHLRYHCSPRRSKVSPLHPHIEAHNHLMHIPNHS